MNSLSFLSTYPAGTTIYHSTGRGASKRVYQCSLNPDTNTVTCELTGIVFTNLKKWAIAVRRDDHGEQVKAFDVWATSYIRENGRKVYLKALKPRAPARGMDPIHWMVRVGDGKKFWSAAGCQVWGANSTTLRDIHFLNNVRAGDILWFIANQSHGKVLAVATYTGTIDRMNNVLDSHTNEELGWSENGKPIDTEIIYKDLRDLRGIPTRVETNNKHYFSFSRYDDPNTICDENLPTRFSEICRYVSVTQPKQTVSVPLEWQGLF